jgi:hypothetical protein
MKTVTQALSIAGFTAVLYVAAFFAYRWRAESTADSRPHGVPAWYFIYPTQTVAERTVYGLFYPCVRIDQIVRDRGESPDA